MEDACVAGRPGIDQRIRSCRVHRRFPHLEHIKNVDSHH